MKGWIWAKGNDEASAPIETFQAPKAKNHALFDSFVIKISGYFYHIAAAREPSVLVIDIKEKKVCRHRSLKHCKYGFLLIVLYLQNKCYHSKAAQYYEKKLKLTCAVERKGPCAVSSAAGHGSLYR